MARKVIKDSGKSRPRKKARVGRFQISTWVFRRLLSTGDKDSITYIEKWVDVERACIQFSRRNRATGRWENQSIWCSIDDLRDLAAAHEKLDEAEVEDSSSPSPSGRCPEPLVENTKEDNGKMIEQRGDRISPTQWGKIPMKNEVMRMRRMRLHKLAEYLKSVDFYHDTFDLDDYGIDKVLIEYGIYDRFTNDELAELAEVLYQLAEKTNRQEALRLAFGADIVAETMGIDPFQSNSKVLNSAPMLSK